MSILTIDHISKYYNLDGTNQERALNDVTLEIASGKITAISVHLAVVRPVCLVLLVAWIVSIKEIFISKIKTCEIFQSVT